MLGGVVPPFRHARSADVRPVEMGPGLVRRTLGCGDLMLLAEIFIQKGGVVPSHSHPHEQIGYVAKGKLEFTVAGEKAVIDAGGGYTIAGGAAHSVLALEDSIAIDVFSPVREDYR